GKTDLWAITSADRSPRRLTAHAAGDNSPRWSPDGRWLYFLSSRSDSNQVWRLPMTGGGEALQVTDLALDVAGFVLAPDGRHLALALEVFPQCHDAEAGPIACTVERQEANADDGTSAQVYDQMFVRHWDTWKDGRRNHVFVGAIGDDGRLGDVVDVMGAMDADAPSKPFGGMEEVTFSADSQHVVFTARDVGPEEPWSTDFDLYAAPVDGSTAPRQLTDNPAWDTQPAFSPDGKTLAYLAMARPGYESDRLRLVLRAWPEGEPEVLTEDWDRSIGGFFWAPDGKTLYATAQDTGAVRLFAVEASSGAVTELWGTGHVRSPALAGDFLVFGLDTLGHPVDLFSIPAGGLADGASPTRLTDVNAERMAEITMGEYAPFSFAGWNDETVHGWVVKPSGFEEGQRYPVAFLIHGGPQGSFDNDFHYRWNPQTYAAAGYAVVTIDFHGSTGYGQAFTDSIAGDWGGKPLEDLRKGWAAALERYPWLDGERACALGASYGGYMINWIAGNWPDAFDCLVNHDGLFNLESMYFATEELWFVEWEHGGPPWVEGSTHDLHNPARHVEKWRTPMLVIHGALDYRVPETEGLQTFTALQRRGVPSRFLFFPDENHWVLKPNNSMKWHAEVIRWLDQWTAASP
ncbi:MAG: S9 family peptidase, partial [Acidobacteriota bacterium]